MKVNEVRFNNWVNFKYKGVDYGNVMIDKNYFSHYENKDYEYTPIPLTEEWLLKFRFDMDDEYIGHNIDIGSSFISFNKKTLGCNYGESPIKYVHTLQNLYYALTGKELKSSTK